MLPRRRTPKPTEPLSVAGARGGRVRTDVAVGLSARMVEGVVMFSLAEHYAAKHMEERAAARRRRAAWWRIAWVLVTFVTWMSLLAATCLGATAYGYELVAPEHFRMVETEASHFGLMVKLFCILAVVIVCLAVFVAVNYIKGDWRDFLLIAVATFVLLGILAGRCFGAGLEDCIDATCRVSAGSGRGTGVAFEHSQDTVFVLTNAHVVGRQTTVQCEFWRAGEVQKAVTGQVGRLMLNDTVDVAVIAIAESQFNGALPQVIPLAPQETRVATGATVLSVGCAGATWPTAWRGKILRSQYGDLRFWPVPADGRSGAAIFTADGSKIIGLIRARTTDGREGVACSLKAIYQAMSQRLRSAPGNTQPKRGPVPDT